MIRFWDFKLSGAPPLLSWVSFGVNRMTRDVLRDNYRESWANLSAFVERFPDDQWLDWKNFMRPVVRAAIEAGLSDHFRAGQSMSHLIFSTAEEHGLEPIEPPPLRVTLGRDDASTEVAPSV